MALGIRYTSIVILLCCLSAGPAQPADDPVVTLEHATLIDGVSDRPVEDSLILIADGSIAFAGAHADADVPAHAERVDLSGNTIIPGLFDLHVHVGLVEGLEIHGDLYTLERLERDARLALYYGVMHLVSLGHDFEPVFEFRELQPAGEAAGARLYTAGAGFAPPNGWRPPVQTSTYSDSDWMSRPGTPAEARKMVRIQASRDVDLIKIWMDDLGGKGAKFTPPVFGAIIDEAHRHGLRVFAHVVTLADAKTLVRHGVDALAHVVHDQEVDAGFLELARRHGTFQITTLVRFRTTLDYANGDFSWLDDPGLSGWFPDAGPRDLARGYMDTFGRRRDPEVLRRDDQVIMRNLAAIAGAGIPVATGTDTAAPAHFFGLSMHREMERMATAGMTPLQIIRAATIQSARALGIEARYGSVERGKVADFIVLHADPLADISNTRKIAALWMNGQKVDRKALADRRQPGPGE